MKELVKNKNDSIIRTEEMINKSVQVSFKKQESEISFKQAQTINDDDLISVSGGSPIDNFIDGIYNSLKLTFIYNPEKSAEDLLYVSGRRCYNLGRFISSCAIAYAAAYGIYIGINWGVNRAYRKFNK